MIEFKQDELQEFLQTLDPELLRKAQRQALNRVRAKTATRISAAARGKYNVSAATVRDALSRRLKFSTTGDRSEAYLVYLGRRIGLINFGAKFKKVSTARGPRLGATTKLYKGRPRYLTKRGFIATGKSGNVHVFQRAEEGQRKRHPLKALYGPSIPQMVGSREILEDADSFVQKEYPIELLRQIDYYMSKQ